jgi:hypothetical protein
MLRAKNSLELSGYRVWLYVGFIYGRKRTTTDAASGIIRLASKEFWTKITGDSEFYRKLLAACACLAPLYQADINAARQRILSEANRNFTKSGDIDWDKVLETVMG